MDPQWVALHKDVSARLDRQRIKTRAGGLYHGISLSLAFSPYLSPPLPLSTHTWPEPSTQWCLSQLRGRRFVEKSPLSSGGV